MTSNPLFALLKNAAAGLTGQQYTPSSSSASTAPSSSVSSAPSSTASASSTWSSVSGAPSSSNSSSTVPSSSTSSSSSASKGKKRARPSVDVLTDGLPWKQLRRPGEDAMDMDVELDMSMAKGGSKAHAVDDVEDVVLQVKGKGKGRADVEDVLQVKGKGKGRADVEDEPLDGMIEPREVSGEQEQRDLKNTQRRAVRHQAAIDHPEKAVEQRKESGRGRCEVVASFWTDDFVLRASTEVQVQYAAAAQLSEFQTVEAVVQARCDAEQHLQIPATTLASIPPRTISFLATVANQPTTFDIAPFLANGVLALSKRGDPPPIKTCANYIRLIAVPGDMATESLSKYLVAYPADAANTLLQLILQGQDLKKSRAIFRVAMEEFGLENAVDEFFDTVEKDSTALSLMGSRRATSQSQIPYNGFTTSVACADRCWDDLEQGSHVRIINFLSTNKELMWETYHICDLDTAIEDELDVRTNPEISHKERIVRAILGTSAMNSAPGGTQPLFTPSPQQRLLHERIRSLYTLIPTPLGSEQDPAIERQVEALIDDEVRLVGPMHRVKIAASALEDVKAKVAGVLRFSKGRLVTLEITKDLPLEGMLGRCGGYWDSTVGPGPQEDRYLRTLFHPQIPTTGNLSLDTIACYIGPYVDFWRVTLWHILYWLHVLLLSRLLAVLRPIIITSQSSPVAAMMESGDLVTVWKMVPQEELDQFIAGHSPHELNQHFPCDFRYREFRGGEFNRRLGSIRLVRTGPDPSKISLYIPSADAGRSKYDPTLARRRWVVDYYVRLVSLLLIQVVALLLQQAIPDWENAEASHEWLSTAKSLAEEKLAEAGVTQALEVAKSNARKFELAANFLRSIQASKHAHDRFVENGGNAQPRRAGIVAIGKPSSAERKQQLMELLTEAHTLDHFDLPPDPNHLGSWAHPILSDSFGTWFLELREGTDIVYASNALGRTEEGYEGVQEKNRAFGEWRRNTPIKVDISGIERRDLVRSVKEVAGGEAYLCGDVLKAPRFAHCRACDSFVIARHNDAKHRCSADNRHRQVTAKEFPDLERVLYAHDILNHPQMLAALGDKYDVLAELGLLAFPVQPILDRSRPLLQKILPVVDFTAFSALPPSLDQIYAPIAKVDDENLLLNMAFDVVLKTNSTCPPYFEPLNPDGRLAWRMQQSKFLMDWFSSRRDLYMVTCHGAPGKNKLPHFFLSKDVKPRKDGTGFWINGGGRACGLCGGHGCDYRQYRKVTSIFDLPSHHARHIWLCLRRGVEWVRK